MLVRSTGDIGIFNSQTLKKSNEAAFRKGGGGVEDYIYIYILSDLRLLELRHVCVCVCVLTHIVFFFPRGGSRNGLRFALLFQPRVYIIYW